jgi:hypothetical protein
MHQGMYHGDEFLPVGYGGIIGDFFAGLYKYTVVAPLVTNEPPCILAYRTVPDIFTLGIASWVRGKREVEYRELQKIEDKIQRLRNDWKAASVVGGGRASINNQICDLINKKQDLTRRLKAAKKSEEQTQTRREQRQMERDLATSSSTYAPYDPMTGGMAPAGAASVPAGAQTTAMTGGETGGGISTTTMLAVGAGALLLFALMNKKSASAPASAFKGF